MIADYEICQVDLPGFRSLRSARLDSSVFFGIQEWHKLSAGHKSSGVLLRVHWRGGRVANRLLDNLKRTKAIWAIDDCGGDRKIQLWSRGIGFIWARPSCRPDSRDRFDRSDSGNTLRRRI